LSAEIHGGKNSFLLSDQITPTAAGRRQLKFISLRRVMRFFSEEFETMGRGELDA
jgi:hypothetical protein